MTRRLALLAAAGLLTCGCGISAESSPRVLPQDSGRLAPVTSSPSAQPSNGTQVTIYLVRDDDRTLITRQRLLAAPVASPEDLLASLVTGPVGAESTSGLFTAVPQGVRVQSLDPTTRVLRVEISDEPVRTDEQFAYGQIVLTMSRSPLVTGGVQFTRGGEVIQVPDGEGKPSSGPLTAADYRGLIRTG